MQTLSPIAGAALPPPAPAQPQAPAPEPAQSSNGDLTGENTNGVVTAGSDAAALAQSASMIDSVLRIPPSMAVLDRCATCCKSASWQLTTWLCSLLPQAAWQQASQAADSSLERVILHLKTRPLPSILSLHTEAMQMLRQQGRFQAKGRPSTYKLLAPHAAEGALRRRCRCPLAAPTGAALQSTRRGSRYWRLRSAVAAAVHRVGGGGAAAAAPPSQEGQPSPLPSKLEVRIMQLLS